ncbi:copper oxidase [Vitiosangium sp. GDMCC 1.1324]|uniref:copper oxidase n=1 Tax=Vitiosangium sp. (strain GDMCC 1.1324) TaxID=2138576 RepID=UPI000D3364F1|nr:copper oxidase [Vitiosangium sp. GDMCC 1.1324]PTL85977.1 copper oxidase [Vitiosangium sp. GDMCC 1.1324]
MPLVEPSIQAGLAVECKRTITADVVALDQVYTYNRFGSYNPTGMMYALRRDVEPIDGSRPIGPGNVRLRLDKRPRPLTLRANVGDCLQIHFTNWLAPTRSDIPSPHQSQPTVTQVGEPGSGYSMVRKLLPTWVFTPSWNRVASFLEGKAVGGIWFFEGQDKEFDNNHKDDSPYTRRASVHVQGLQYWNVANDDGAFVGQNPSSLVKVGDSHTYNFYADHEGAFFMYSMGASFGGEGDGGSTAQGLFGAVNVEPAGSSWYRSKVSAAVLQTATRKDSKGLPLSNPDGTPLIDYEARDSKGRPLLNILDTGTNEIVHGDLEAIVTGYTRTSVGTFTSKDQGHFREITALYHDEIKAVQAFDELDWNPTFHGVRDGFGINYGVAGAGAELLANRAKIGPTKDCADCMYEEFFLESWANGDPALNVEKDWKGQAVRALYPDDPSNVHHSYLGDPVRIRNIHAGPAETHVFHLHAHQWKLSPGEENSNYLDSQTIGPGSSFTYDINYGGSGNRNLTPGDSIHHCHLYPHFAQGMWALWRVHDVFEAGTKDRLLPDAEITGGTPNPAVIPIPARAMPPMPTYVDTLVTDASGAKVLRPAFPGYPFYVAGKAGHRAPQPPLDIEEDGGLPRHIITKAIGPSTYGLPGKRFYVDHHALDVKLLPQDGTPMEKKAMSFHGGEFPSASFVPRPYYTTDIVAAYPSYTATGAPGFFYVNGRKPVAGAPFADPCPTSAPRREYRAAYLQIDLQNMNRAGWHDRQARLMVLNDDVTATQSGARPPEPFFFRAESGECITFYPTNLIPNELEADDYQVYTPTDTIGQHIHLVKFDVMAADGAGNGWNYEDGTFSFQEVLHRIDKITTAGGAYAADGTVDPSGPRVQLTAKVHPRLGVMGAQTTTQRWWADPLTDAKGQERTIETVFSHDHFGPSSHQQHGFYGALIVEPKGSKWRHPQTGVYYGTRPSDGGPTSWQADILTKDPANSFREFALAFGDYAIAYDECGQPVNPPNYKETSLPWAVDFEATPLPEAISAADPGTMLINYRNEPIPLRISQRPTRCANRVQRTDTRGDMANVFRSDLHGDPYTPLLRGYEGDKVKIRLIQGSQEEQHSFTLHGNKWLREGANPHSGYFNAQPIGMSEHFEFNLTNGLPPIGGTYETADYMYQSASSGDLWNGMWGLMRTYKKKQSGLKTLGHLALQAADYVTLDSSALSYKELLRAWEPVPLLEMPVESVLVKLDPDKEETIQVSDEVDDEGKKVATRTLEYAMAYPEEMKKLDPRLVEEAEALGWFGIKPAKVDACPRGSVVRIYRVSAIDAANWLPGGRLVYNSEYGIFDPDAILFARDEYLTDLRSGARKPEPLILRARAGECVQVVLTNRLPTQLKKTPQWAHHSAITRYFNVNQVRPSNHVSLHPQLVNYDVNTDDGANVGLNALQTVPPGGKRVYRWYTGDFRSYTYASPIRRGIYTPVEFGIVNLRNMADVVNHGMHGGIGALIIEPPDATWTTDSGTDAQARVRHTNVAGQSETFRELVLLYQDDLGLHSTQSQFWDTDGLNSGTALRNISGIDDSQDTGLKAFNYRTEPLWARLGVPPQTDPEDINDMELGDILSSAAYGDPATPLFTANAGELLRMRVGHPSGHSRQHAFALHGAEWYANAWANGASSLRMGPNPTSYVIATQGGMSVMQSWNFIPEYGAGGVTRAPGDYLYRDMPSFQWSGGGLWGVLRVK